MKVALHAGGDPPSGGRPFLARALESWQELTPAQLLIPATMGLLWGLGNTLGWWIGHGVDNVARSAAHFVYEAALPMTLLLLGLPLAERTARDRANAGPPSARPYAVAALVAAIGGEALFVLTAPLFGLDRCGCDTDRWPQGARIANMLPDGLLICGFLAAGYYFRRRSAQRAAALRVTQLEGAQLARQTLESKLQTMQARVEPEFLFDTLVEIERLYESDVPRANRILDQLIVYLRAALPRLHDATSTMGKELELAQAYLAILRMRHGERLAFTVAAPAEARCVPFAPMLILPLIDHAVAAGPSAGAKRCSIDVVASLIAGRLRLVVCSEGTQRVPDQDSVLVDTLRTRLTALYGVAAKCDVRSEGMVTIATVEVSLEGADGPHR
jgi:hypothetical protein